MVDESFVERLARSVHEQYLREQTRDGVAMESTPAMTSWVGLAEEKRAANRDQARDLFEKLDRIACGVAAAAHVGAPFVFTDAEVDDLARQEQIRWAEQRLFAGWVYGPTRDDEARRHPSLVSWDELPESERDKDRDAVRNIPAVLAVAGIEVRRTRAGP